MAKLIKARESWAANRAAFAAWLDATPEEALEPELPIVDPHHHAWDMRELEGFNLFGLFKQQYYLADEMVDDFVGGGHNITHTVYAEAHSFHSADTPGLMAPLGEVVTVQGLAAQFASGKYGDVRVAAGIIGTADLAKLGAEVEPLLVACKAASPNFRGIRVTGAFDPDIQFGVGRAGLYAEPKFREGFALLAPHELVFDAFLYSSQVALAALPWCVCARASVCLLLRRSCGVCVCARARARSCVLARVHALTQSRRSSPTCTPWRPRSPTRPSCSTTPGAPPAAWAATQPRPRPSWRSGRPT